MVSPSSLGLVSCNLLSEISTRLLHSGPATKVRICLPKVVNWDEVVESREEKKEEADARQDEEQQALGHARHRTRNETLWLPLNKAN